MCCCFCINLNQVSAQEERIIKENDVIVSRGATDYYYTPISHSFYNERGITYLGKKTFNTGFSVQCNVGPFTFTAESYKSGTYEEYSSVVDVTLTARKTDAMGHDLGIETFTYKGFTLYKYIPV